eukprot:5527543-Pleurochrysis_carterae.AAC.1
MRFSASASSLYGQASCALAFAHARTRPWGALCLRACRVPVAYARVATRVRTRLLLRLRERLSLWIGLRVRQRLWRMACATVALVCGHSCAPAPHAAFAEFVPVVIVLSLRLR